MKRLLNELHAAGRSRRLIPDRSSILIAFSGGPDSVCLALALSAWRASRHLRLAAAHVHHGLRPEASADARWARDFCADAGIPFYSLRVDVRKRSKAESESIEEAARRARYRALLDVAVKEKFDRLATAHTADDQAETVLMRLASGSGLWGLAAIPAERVERGVRIVRPLLGVSKSDILAALKRAGQKFLKDRTNADPSFLRNRLRLDVLPRLRKTVNPRIMEHLSDVASDASEWRSWAAGEADIFLTKHARARAGRLTISEAALKALPAPIRVPVYFKICERLTRREQHLRREHIRQIEDLLGARNAGERRLMLGLTVRRTLSGGSPQMVWSSALPHGRRAR